MLLKTQRAFPTSITENRLLAWVACVTKVLKIFRSSSLEPLHLWKLLFPLIFPMLVKPGFSLTVDYNSTVLYNFSCTKSLV